MKSSWIDFLGPLKRNWPATLYVRWRKSMMRRMQSSRLECQHRFPGMHAGAWKRVTWSQKRVLPNFGNNFAKSRPIFKILLPIKRNWIWDKSPIISKLQLVWKTIHNCHISRILILHSLAQFKLDASGNVTIQQVIDIIFASFVPVWSTHMLDDDEMLKITGHVMRLSLKFCTSLWYCPFNGFFEFLCFQGTAYCRKLFKEVWN
jgi:hypothetical protein